MNKFSSSAALGVLALLALTARGYAQDAADTAQPDAGAQNEAPQRYEIEIILFANTNADPSSELFSVERPAAAPAAAPLPLQPLPYGGETAAELQSVPGTTPPADVQPGTTARAPNAAASGAAELQAIPDVSPGDAAAGSAAAQAPQDGASTSTPPPQAFQFRLLKPDEMKLNAEYAKIRRIGTYRPLGHAAWVQEGLPEDQARPIDMAELGIANPSGTIQLHVSRYLHVSLNLTYRTNPPAANAPAGVDSPAGADSSAGALAPADQPAAAQAGGEAAGLGTVTVAPRYVMHQQRRIRSGELQYFDHPMFGVLLLVTPAPKQAPVQPAGGNGALTPAA